MLQLPPEEGAERTPAEMVLMRPFVPFSEDDSRQQLTAFMAARMDPGHYGELVTYEMPSSDLPEGPGIAAANIVWETTLQAAIPNDVLSRVSSFDWLVSLVFQPAGFALAGPAADTFGRSETLWAAATLTATSTLLILAVPSVRGLRRAGY